MLNRVERLHDVVPASLPVFGRFWQVLQVDQQVLRPILYVLLGCRPVRMLADPFADVIGKPLVELLEISWDDKSVASDVAAISDRKGIGLVGLLFNKQIGKFFNFHSIALHGDTLLRKEFELHASKHKRSR